MIAILPAAGKGSRMKNISGEHSKEMLELGRHPVIWWVIQEAKLSLPDSIHVVSHPSKRDLNEYLAKEFPEVKIGWQTEQLGLGHAISQVVDNDEAMVLLADTVLLPAPSFQGSAGKDCWVLCEEVQEEVSGLYGMIQWKSGPQSEVQAIVEKPKAGTSPSRFAVSARYFLSAEMRLFLATEVRDRESVSKNGGKNSPEIGLSESINKAIQCDVSFFGKILLPPIQRFDCGSADGYQSALNHIEDGVQL